MIAPTITDYGLEFAYLYARETTDLIVIHHTGNPTNDDMSAEQIHASHIYNNGWSGIGYHYVVRKNGDIEFGSVGTDIDQFDSTNCLILTFSKIFPFSNIGPWQVTGIVISSGMFSPWLRSCPP